MSENSRTKSLPRVSDIFGQDTFSFAVMKEKLPRAVFDKLMCIINEDEPFEIEVANAVAHAMKEWAIERGATHYCHWFQPMTQGTAEKHDSFIEFTDAGDVIERFSGKQLVKGEPDASSFPTGGIRSTFEARGYTAWDITSPAFLLKTGGGTTLCIPSAFVSYTGDALDLKTPLLRSLKAVSKAASRLLTILGNPTKKVSVMLGPEQEYFLIDLELFRKRKDLVLCGRTLLGAPPPKGQQLEDHYLGAIRERVLSFMVEFESELYRLGIPAKTRHNEVAPGQYELAVIYEEANLAIDHNQLIMNLLKTVARRHSLAALLHEKPFAYINGSGKHANWSLMDEHGKNLLDPGKTPEENLQFLAVFTCIINAVWRYGHLLRASVATAANDLRLGANEAPPAIISVYPGEELMDILESYRRNSGFILQEERNHVDIKDKGGSGHKLCSKKEKDAALSRMIDLHLPSLATLRKDTTDRNRTSPFAFTGNKFEFRAVGSSMSVSFPITVLNTIVADSMERFVDAVDEILKHSDGEAARQKTISRRRGKHRLPMALLGAVTGADRSHSKTISSLHHHAHSGGQKESITYSPHAIQDAVLQVIQQFLNEAWDILFTGDGYSKEWEKEAERRGLRNSRNTPDALKYFTERETCTLFEKHHVLTERELMSRYNIMLERYIKTVLIEARTLIDMVNTQVLPASLKYQQDVASSLSALSKLRGKGSHPETSLIQLLNKTSSAVEMLVSDTENLTEKLNTFSDIPHHGENGKKDGEERLRLRYESLASGIVKEIIPLMNSIRKNADLLEQIVSESLWPLPKYWQMLFLV